MRQPIIYFAKVRPSAIIPSKRREDLGYDIYANFKQDFIVIQPHQTVMIPTGIASSLSEEWGIVLRERGSTGTKGMAIRAGVIDSGYRSEWFVPITNVNTKPIVITKEDTVSVFEALADDYIIYPYTKAIAQAIVVENYDSKVIEIDYEELLTHESERGVGAVGSSGK
jgi:dUTP pyrophosphatase